MISKIKIDDVSFRPSEQTMAVILIAEEAGRLLLSYFRKKLEIQNKNNDAFDPVTTADVSADNLIRTLLTNKFPNDLVLSEENSNIPLDYSRRIWMVDPLDGTKDFIKGKDSYSIHIGLYEGGNITFGLVLAPARGRMFFAEKGRGAFEQIRPGRFNQIHVSIINQLSQARIITRSPGLDKRPLDKIVEEMHTQEKIADSGIKVPRIACGEAEAHLNTNFRASKWDTLAPQIILEEAGGTMVDIDGNPLNYEQTSLRWERSYIAANNSNILRIFLDEVRKNNV